MQMRRPDHLLKPNLVIVTGQPLWFRAGHNTSWDLIVIQDANATVTCPACLLTFITSPAGRYQQLWQLTQSKPWSQLNLEQYKYVYFSAGDTYHEFKQIERLFEMMLHYELVLAHPSICSGLESQSLLTDMLKQQPINVLRFTTAVDVLAPVFDTAFFQDTVVQTLRNATFGHGLQWLWPFLIGYRPRKMAILDEVCVVHPQDHLQYLLKLDLQSRMHLQTLAQKQKPTPSKFRLRMRLSQPTTSQKRLKSDIPVQALTGAPGRNFLHTDAPSAESAQKEAGLLLKQYSYRAELYGVKDRSGEVLEAVFQPWYQTLLDMGSIQVSAVRSLHHLAVWQPEHGLHPSASITHPVDDTSVLQLKRERN